MNHTAGLNVIVYFTMTFSSPDYAARLTFAENYQHHVLPSSKERVMLQEGQATTKESC